MVKEKRNDRPDTNMQSQGVVLPGVTEFYFTDGVDCTHTQTETHLQSSLLSKLNVC